MAKVWLVKSNGQGIDFGSDTHQATFKQDLKENLGKVYRIERVVSKRTGQQNRYFWFYLGLVESETGNSTKDMHEYCVKYLTPKVERSIRLLKDGKWIEHKGIAGKGTSELNKLEMGEVLDKLCSLTDVPLPNPEEAGYIIN